MNNMYIFKMEFEIVSVTWCKMMFIQFSSEHLAWYIINRIKNNSQRFDVDIIPRRVKKVFGQLTVRTGQIIGIFIYVVSGVKNETAKNTNYSINYRCKSYSGYHKSMPNIFELGVRRIFGREWSVYFSFKINANKLKIVEL